MTADEEPALPDLVHLAAGEVRRGVVAALGQPDRPIAVAREVVVFEPVDHVPQAAGTGHLRGAAHVGIERGAEGERERVGSGRRGGAEKARVEPAGERQQEVVAGEQGPAELAHGRRQMIEIRLAAQGAPRHLARIPVPHRSDAPAVRLKVPAVGQPLDTGEQRAPIDHRLQSQQGGAGELVEPRLEARVTEEGLGLRGHEDVAGDPDRLQNGDRVGVHAGQRPPARRIVESQRVHAVEMGEEIVVPASIGRQSDLGRVRRVRKTELAPQLRGVQELPAHHDALLTGVATPTGRGDPRRPTAHAQSGAIHSKRRDLVLRKVPQTRKHRRATTHHVRVT